MNTDRWANRETILAPAVRTSFKAAFAIMPYGGAAHFEWSDDFAKLDPQPPTVGGVLDNLARLMDALVDASARANANTEKLAAFDRDMDAARRLLVRLLPRAGS